MPNPNAYYDCLSICVNLETNLGNTSITEIHLFSYLSCLLSLFKEHPVSMWGYSFSVTTTSHPFSVDIDEEIINLVNNDCLSRNSDYLKVTQLGKEQYKFLSELSQYAERELFIKGACSTILALPVGFVRKAVSQGSEINYAVALEQNSLLLGEGAVDDIYRQFSALSSIIGVDTKEMIVPAVLWLTYIASSE